MAISAETRAEVKKIRSSAMSDMLCFKAVFGLLYTGDTKQLKVSPRRVRHKTRMYRLRGIKRLTRREYRWLL